jgi:hypothetical protein
MKHVTNIRHFTPNDIPQVAALWMRTWRSPRNDPPDNLLAYYNTLFFKNPWVGLGVQSLVHESADGRIDGFLGLMPRPMTLDGSPILAAASCGFMVAPKSRNQGIAQSLRRRSFEGPQQLVFSDGASRTAKAIWLGAGGEACPIYSQRWSRTLLPAANLLQRSARRLGVSMAPIKSAARFFDALSMHSPIGAHRLPQNDCDAIENPKAAEILKLRDALEPDAKLRPVYEERSFDWLLAQTADAKTRGTLESIIVTDSSGERIGWYIYFANPQGVSDVMQIGAHPEKYANVLSHLMIRARSKGSVALMGQLDTRYADALANAGCKFTDANSFYLYSRDANILQAVRTGQTSLSRLDGEWWLHFSDGPW